MDFRSVLAESVLFSRLSPQALDVLAGKVGYHEISSGDVLFKHGEPSQRLYTVASGRMRAMLPNGTIAGDIGRGESIGEIGLLAGEPHGATVYAVRDSELLSVKREDLADLVQQFPAALLEATRVVIRRLRQNQASRKLESSRNNRAFALIPATRDVDVRPVALALAEALRVYGSTRLLDPTAVDDALGSGAAQTQFSGNGGRNAELITWLNDLESVHRYLVYTSNSPSDAWSRRCMRQADRVLVVADATSPAADSPTVDALKAYGTRAHVEMLMLRRDTGPAGDVLGWRESIGARTHYFLRPGSKDDIASLARQITGRGIGLVLGGGGARGFAHIGMLRALAELKIPIDSVGGTSMGAFFGALIACGYDPAQITEIARETYVKKNFLNDYLFPTVALIRGRKFVRRLHEIFQDRQIEQLRTPFFCVSTNLTRGTAMVHDRGPLHLWLATSMAVPGVAPPVGYRGELLADGAVVNSLPTDIMQSLERGPIIASDVSTEGDLRAPGVEGPDPEALFHWGTVGKRPGLMSIIFRTATLTSESGVAARAARADLYVRMPVSGVGLFDWNTLDEVSERGYRYALEKLSAVKSDLVK
ncbi:MAG TPA: patatin-like phospholipase family protein [Nevskiaceae bacterium]|nr:patatin-like phospholipase family protein [Nevskiaceae bacterium]